MFLQTGTYLCSQSITRFLTLFSRLAEISPRSALMMDTSTVDNMTDE